MPVGARLKRLLLWGPLLIFLLYAGLIAVRVLYPIDYIERLVHWSDVHRLDPALVGALVRAESRYRADAVSSRGAIGLMQIMPETGLWIAEQLGLIGFDPSTLVDPDINLRLGTWYLANLLERFDTPRRALQAYNAGPSRALEWLDHPEDVFPETETYVKRVLQSVFVYRAYIGAPWIPRAVPRLPL